MWEKGRPVPDERAGHVSAVSRDISHCAWFESGLEQEIFSPKIVHTGSGAHRALCSICYRSLSRG